MIYINKEELLKIARMSNLHIDESEIPSLLQQLQDVLNYAERVKQLATQPIEEISSKNINFFRDDIIKKTDSEPIVAQAPEREGNYFVVPMILEK